MNWNDMPYQNMTTRGGRQFHIGNGSQIMRKQSRITEKSEYSDSIEDAEYSETISIKNRNEV